MTRKELITACVDEQIERGIIGSEHRDFVIKCFLKGGCGIKPLKLELCRSWYNCVFNSKVTRR